MGFIETKYNIFAALLPPIPESGPFLDKRGPNREFPGASSSPLICSPGEAERDSGAVAGVSRWALPRCLGAMSFLRLPLPPSRGPGGTPPRVPLDVAAAPRGGAGGSSSPPGIPEPHSCVTATYFSAAIPPQPNLVSQEMLASSAPTDWARISFLSVPRAQTRLQTSI